jgi:hypothetical protein
MDGNISLYDDQYSNDVDWNDGTKMNNSGENWGLIRNGVSLAVERRRLVTGADTAYFNMWGMQQRNYRFEVKMYNFDATTQVAFVWDEFLRRITPVDFVNLTTIDFTVTANPASKAANRFKLIYTTPLDYITFYNSVNSTLPVNITGITAARKNEDVLVTWSVENELSLDNYKVEYSADGREFKAVETVSPLNTSISHSYNYTDINAGKAVRFYRIRSTNMDGKLTYSNIAKVAALNEQAGVNVYPNPVTNKVAQLQWNSLAAMEYKVMLVYPNGKMQQLKTIKVPAGQSSGTLELPREVTPGTYQLRFTGSTNSSITKTIIVL